MKYKVQLDKMLQDIASYFEARFTDEPAIQEITFPSSHRLCVTLNKAGVSLWLYSDKQVSYRLADPCIGGPHREFRPTRNRDFSWVFHRPERLSHA